MIFLGHLLAELLAKKTPAFSRYKKNQCIHNSTASFSLVLLLPLLVGCFLVKRSMPRQKFGSSSLVSSIDYRKVQQQELAAKLDGSFAAKCNCTRHVIYARPCVYRAFSLTWLALCKSIGTKGSIYVRKDFNSHRIGLVHQYGPRFIVFGTPIWPPWRHMKTLYRDIHHDGSIGIR